MKAPKCRTCGELHWGPDCSPVPPIARKLIRRQTQVRGVGRRVHEVENHSNKGGASREIAQQDQSYIEKLNPRRRRSAGPKAIATPARLSSQVVQTSPSGEQLGTEIQSSRGTTTHQYRDPEKRKAYMAKYMRERRAKLRAERNLERAKE